MMLLLTAPVSLQSLLLANPNTLDYFQTDQITNLGSSYSYMYIPRALENGNIGGDPTIPLLHIEMEPTSKEGRSRPNVSFFKTSSYSPS